MPLWRRESFHEKLAREGGLVFERDVSEKTKAPWDKAGIHGLPRPRRWEAVVAVAAPGVPGDELAFTRLPNGTLLLEEDVPAEAVAPIAEELERVLAPPYVAEAVRRSGEVWAAGARSIAVTELPEGTPGDAITVARQGGERATYVDGERWLASLPALQEVAEERVEGDYVLEAERLDDRLWQIRVSPL
jgi:hypothetical protein